MGIIISVINNKGGVGKTLVSCNLAHALGNQGYRVLVVDFDSQSNATSILLRSQITANRTLHHILDPGTSPTKTDLRLFAQNTDCNNVWLIPNVSQSALLEREIIKCEIEKNSDKGYLKFKNTVRDYAIDEYDVIICDCPPNMGTFVLCSLYASDFALVPIRAGSAFSIEGLIKAFALIENIRTESNPDLRFLRLLINCRDARTAISKTIIEQVRSTFDPDQIFKTEIPVNTAFERAEALKETILQYDGTATGARAFRNLAKELMSILEG